MLAGNDREALLRVADALSVELGYAGEEVPGAGAAVPGRGVMSGILSPEDELLVAAVRRGLAKVAAAASGGELEGGAESAVYAALDSAETVIRGELLSGKAAHLPALMPSFVFMVTLAVADQDRALELSRRTSGLIDAALGG